MSNRSNISNHITLYENSSKAAKDYGPNFWKINKRARGRLLDTLKSCCVINQVVVRLVGVDGWLILCACTCQWRDEVKIACFFYKKLEKRVGHLSPKSFLKVS